MLIEWVAGAAGFGAWRAWRRRRDARAGDTAEASRRGTALGNWLLVVEQTGADALDDAVDGLRRQFGRLRGAGPEPGQPDDADGPPPGDEPRAPGERAAERRLLRGVSTLGVTAAGTMVAPALLPLSVAGLLVGVASLVDNAVTRAVDERRFGLAGLDALAASGLVALGQLQATAVFGGVLGYLHWLIAQTRDRSQQNLADLFGDMAQTVWRISDDGTQVEIPLPAIDVGDRIAVRAGQVVPVDGVITDGAVAVDERALTGEEHLAERRAGARLLAGTWVQQGTAIVEVESAGQDTVAAKVVQTLLDTTDYRSELELKGVRIAEASVAPLLALSGLTLALLGPVSALAIFMCSFGYHMRLTGPLATAGHLRAAARHHIFVKDGRALEQIGDVDTIVFDKTGTLTERVPRVTAVHALGAESADALLRWAAAAEFRHAHPIAEAIRLHARSRGLAVSPGDDPVSEVGLGVRAVIDGRTICVGSARFMGTLGLTLPDGAESLRAASDAVGRSLVWVAVDDHIAGALEIGARLRPEVPALVERLRARGLRVVIMSGDQEPATRALATRLRVDDYFAEVLPTDKSAHVEALQATGRTVCFVGDGINDAIALKAARVSVSPRGATTIAADAAQVVLTGDDLGSIEDLLDIGGALDATMKRNFAASTVPSALNLGGVYLLHTGLPAAIALAIGGLVVGAVNSIRPPMLDDREERPDVPPRRSERRP